MHSMEQLLANFRQGQMVRFLLTSPAQQIQHQQFLARLSQAGCSYRVIADDSPDVVLIFSPGEPRIARPPRKGREP